MHEQDNIRSKNRLPATPSATTTGGGFSICMLASGSKGNAIYVNDGDTAILIDAGLSGIEIERRLISRNLSPQSLNAIVVSHEHGDHIKGVGVLSRRYGLPVYINIGTAAACDRLGRLFESHKIVCGQAFNIGRINIHPFSLSHDAADPAGFTLQRGGVKIGIATDLGTVTGMVKTHLRDCQTLVLEANHDPDMLINGSYPWPLKQRIQSRTGHLSNENTRALLAELKHERLHQVILAHLSEENNQPQKALRAIAPVLSGSRTLIEVAPQYHASRIFRIGQ